MATKVISIDGIDRLQQRPAAAAISELQACMEDFYLCMENMARAYPGCVALGGIGGGEAAGIVVIAASSEGTYVSVGAKRAVRELALIAANLPDNLRPIFEDALVKEQSRRSKADARGGVTRGKSNFH